MIFKGKPCFSARGHLKHWHSLTLRGDQAHTTGSDDDLPGDVYVTTEADCSDAAC